MFSQFDDIMQANRGSVMFSSIEIFIQNLIRLGNLTLLKKFSILKITGKTLYFAFMREF
jgi:hypothetical protein